jgi:hypothetical protein
MPDSGEVALEVLLREMAPILHESPYTFCVVGNLGRWPPTVPVFATVHEDEGITVIAPETDVVREGLPGSGSWARISLNIHSALSAVGLTAAVSGALAEVGISANVLAGHFHDHLFVPWGRRREALDVLTKLAGAAQQGAPNRPGHVGEHMDHLRR